MDTIPSITAIGDERPIDRRYPYRLQYFVDHSFKPRNEIELFLNKLVTGGTVLGDEQLLALLPDSGKVLVVCTLKEPVGVLVWVAIGFTAKENCDALASRFSELYQGIKSERFDNDFVAQGFDLVFQRILPVLREIRVSVKQLGGEPEMTHQTELGSMPHDPIDSFTKRIPG